MTPQAAAGWYPDPRGGNGQRYWTGEAWAPDQTQTQQMPQTPQQSNWAPGGGYGTSYLSSHDGGYDPYPPIYPTAATDQQPPAPWRRAATWLALSAGVIAGFGAGFAVADARRDDKPRPIAVAPEPSRAPSSSATQGPGPSPSRTPFPETDDPPSPSASPSAPSRPTDPSAPLLGRIGLRPTDVDPTVTIALIPGGDQVDGQVTLDLCSAKFPSEADRTARRQIAAADSAGSLVMMTEAVLYKSAAALDVAFEELTRAAPLCKATTGVDKNWPQTDGVQRLAFEQSSPADDGSQVRTTGVYLRSGRTLLALYFREPGVTTTPVAGQKTMPTVVTVFARRLAALPTSGTPI